MGRQPRETSVPASAAGQRTAAQSPPLSYPKGIDTPAQRVGWATRNASLPPPTTLPPNTSSSPLTDHSSQAPRSPLTSAHSIQACALPRSTPSCSQSLSDMLPSQRDWKPGLKVPNTDIPGDTPTRPAGGARSTSADRSPRAITQVCVCRGQPAGRSATHPHPGPGQTSPTGRPLS